MPLKRERHCKLQHNVSICQLIQLSIVGCFLLARIAQAQNSPLLSALVPPIHQKGYQLIPEGNKYRLRVIVHELESAPEPYDLPPELKPQDLGDADDSSDFDDNERSEVVELENPGTPDEALSVHGNLTIFYFKSQGLYTITYEAGKNGYITKYKYVGNSPEPSYGYKLSAAALKTCTG